MMETEALNLTQDWIYKLPWTKYNNHKGQDSYEILQCHPLTGK